MLTTIPYIPLFQDLPPAQTSLLQYLFEEFTCPSGTVIFEQGDAADYLYLMLSGRVAIRYKPYDGPALVLTRLGEGNVFGWSAVIGTSKYTSSIVSETPVEAIRIHGRDLWKLAENQPETGRLIFNRLALNVSPRWKDAFGQIQSLLNSHVMENRS